MFQKDAPTVIKTGSHFDVARLLLHRLLIKACHSLNLPNNFPFAGTAAGTGYRQCRNRNTSVIPLLCMPHKTIMERTPFYGAAGPARETKFQYRSRKRTLPGRTGDHKSPLFLTDFSFCHGSRNIARVMPDGLMLAQRALPLST